MEELAQYIYSEDSEGLIEALTQLDLYNLDESRFMKALEICVKACYETQASELLERVFEMFQESNVREENLPLTTEVLLLSRLEISEIKFLFDAEKTVTQAEILDSLTRWDDSEMVTLACQRIGKLFRTEDVTLYELVYQNAYKNNRSRLCSWLKEKITSLKDELEEASWTVKVEALPEIEGRERIIDLEQWTPEKVAEGVFKFMKEVEGIESDDPEKMKQDLATMYSFASDEEKIKLIEPLVPNYEATDIEVFRVLGPLNTHEELDSEDYICGRFGGCRMLTCRCFIDCDEGDDANLIPWFKGKCDKCCIKIRRKEFAFRLPLKDGGWEGCFCSSECCIDSLTEYIESLLPERDENKKKVNRKQVIGDFVREVKTTDEGEEIEIPQEILKLKLSTEKIEEIMILIKRVSEVDDELHEKKIWYTNRPHSLISAN